jgi:hypothetical protein
MKHTTSHATVGFLAIAMILNVRLDAQSTQDVVLSEIRADSAERWVEIHNRGSMPVDLSTWSIYYATDTPSMPQNYWWAFPPGTALAADGYLRVFWFQNSPAAVPPGEYYTGTSPYGYLFSLGGEALRGDRGALALVNSQLGSQMATASHFVDWVSWGHHGFIRESLAVQNGTWSADRQASMIPGGQSLARNTATIGTTTTRDQEWFLDPTPSPMGQNLTGVLVLPYGQACSIPGHHLVGQPELQTTSLPILGNAAFGFVVGNTTGFFGESMLLAFSTSAAPNGLPSLLPLFPGSLCHESIHTGRIVAVRLMATQFDETRVPMSLANLPAAMAGIELHTQALIFDWLPNTYPPFQGISNALMVVIGQ